MQNELLCWQHQLALAVGSAANLIAGAQPNMPAMAHGP